MPEFEEGLHWARCLTCRKGFVPNNPDHAFCSDECALKYKHKRRLFRPSRYKKGTQTVL